MVDSGHAQLFDELKLADTGPEVTGNIAIRDAARALDLAPQPKSARQLTDIPRIGAPVLPGNQWLSHEHQADNLQQVEPDIER